MGRSEFNVYVSQEDGITVASLLGPVDSQNIETFRQKLSAVCGKPGVKVVVDCAELTYLNSRGIGLLVSWHKGLLFTRGALAICNLNPRFVRTLELLNLGKGLPVYPTREEAVAAIK